jgi:hypothetical protein
VRVRVGAMRGMRWVDDRWRVIRASTPSTAFRIVAADVCCYTGVRWHEAQAIASLFGTHWRGSMAHLATAAQQIASCLAQGIGQTSEEANTVVGLDIGLELTDPATGSTRVVDHDLSEGIGIDRCSAAIVARMLSRSYVAQAWWTPRSGCPPVHTPES